MRLVDATRMDPFRSDGSKRELLVRFWYPASAASGCEARTGPARGASGQAEAEPGQHNARREVTRLTSFPSPLRVRGQRRL